MRLLVVVAGLALVLAALLVSCASPSTIVPKLDGGTILFDIGTPDGGSVDANVGDLGPTDDQGRTTCDLGNVDGGADKLFVAAVTSSGAPYVASFEAGAWTAVPTGGSSFSSIVTTQVAGRAMIVTRGTDDTLGSSITNPCAPGLSAPTALFNLALAGGTPAAVGGDHVDVVFRGSLNGDQRLYSTTFTGTWSAANTLGNFLSTLPPAIVRVGTDVHVLFTGTDDTIYDGVVNSSGGAASPISMALSSYGPVATTTSAGTTHVAWVGQDTNLYWAARTQGGSYTTPASLCVGQSSCLITSNLPPIIATDRTDHPVIAWLGTNGIVYVSRLNDDGATWSAPIAATTETTTLAPGLAAGLPGDDLELVYVRQSDSQPRHVSEANGVFSAPITMPGGTVVTTPSLEYLAP